MNSNFLLLSMGIFLYNLLNFDFNVTWLIELICSCKYSILWNTSKLWGITTNFWYEEKWLNIKSLIILFKVILKLVLDENE